ncbi:MFS transporter [Streptococcus intermedius]|uniref:MFS transporter n=1 Tax=Streptococcus intermedius TaxID=1338 RepID=UPI0003906A25|nr:MFS transporter [Streptococcus intermedius]AGU78032.1 putative transport protein [Streptococcus intermedius C270]PMR93068.1 MFS transporter [Streptococcus intermedius]
MIIFRRSYKRNIPLMAGVEFLGFFGITSFWILFLNQNGMSLLQIGLLESIFHTTGIIFEIPSGMLADRFSYKANLYISRLTSILSSVLMLTGQGNFWIYAIAMIINALSYNFDSGTSSALLYDSAVEADLKDYYLKISSLMSGVSEAAISLGTVLAGLFVHGYLYVTYYIMIAVSILVLILIWLIKEPDMKRQTDEVVTIKKIILIVKKEIKSNPSLFMWMMTFQFVGTMMCMFYFYYQKQLPDLVGWQISTVMLIGSVLNILAVSIASKIGEMWHSFRLFPIVVSLTGVAYVLSALGTSFMYILIYLTTNALYAMYQPIFYNDLQQYLPSSARATMLSVASMMFSLSMIIIFPIVGWLIDSFGFDQTFIGLGLVLILLTPLLVIAFQVIRKRLNIIKI